MIAAQIRTASIKIIIIEASDGMNKA